MAGNIKGLTVEIGGDTTKLGQALENVQKKSKSLSGELGQINKLLKMDPGNADLLAQKQEVLAKAVENTREKLATLKKANEQATKSAENYDAWKAKYDPIQAEIDELTQKLKKLKAEQAKVADDEGIESEAYQKMQADVEELTGNLKRLKKQAEAVTKEFGNPAAPEQLRELQREIIATEKKLNGYENAAKETEDALRGMGDASEKAEKSSSDLGKALGGAVKTGLDAVAAVAAAAVAGLTAAAESTREYRTEMGKLEAAYSASNHSAATASAAYKSLIGVIGEVDQSVEAAQQIALLADSEKEVAKWSDLAAGVVGRFGDALQPETFFEAANETLKLNESTGAYTQMLEGCGINVEKFNEKLQACKTTEEKQAYLLEVTEGALGKAGEAYKENNAAIIEANKANDNWMQSLSGIGGAIEPIVTDVKNLGASLLADAVPGVQKLAEAFQGLMAGDAGASGDFAAALSGLVTGLVEKITQALPGLATVGMNIVKTLATSLLQQVPLLLTTAGQIVTQLVTSISTGLPSVVSKGAELLGKLGEGIKTAMPGLISKGLDIIMGLVTALYNAAPRLIDAGFGFIKNLVSGLMASLPTLIAKAPEIISKFVNILNDNVPRILKHGMDIVIQLVKGIIAAIPTLIANIPKIFQAIMDVWQAFNWVSLGKNAITMLKNGITAMGGAIKGAGKNVMDWIVNALKSLPSKLLSLGKTAVSNMRTGIRSMAGAIRAAGGNIFTAIVNALKSLPSNLLNLGKQAITRLGSAIQSGIGTIKAKCQSIVTGVINTFKSLPGKMVQVGKDIISGVINGIGSMVGALYDAISGALSGLVQKAKDAILSNSPSKLFAREVGQPIPQGVAVGIKDDIGVAEDAVADMTGAVRAAAGKGIGGLNFERSLANRARIGAVRASAASVVDNSDILAKLDGIYERLGGLQVVLDSGATIGGLIDGIDRALATKQTLRARGV